MNSGMRDATFLLGKAVFLWTREVRDGWEGPSPRMRRFASDIRAEMEALDAISAYAEVCTTTAREYEGT